MPEEAAVKRHESHLANVPPAPGQRIGLDLRNQTVPPTRATNQQRPLHGRVRTGYQTHLSDPFERRSSPPSRPDSPVIRLLPDSPVTPEVAGSSPVAPVARAAARSGFFAAQPPAIGLPCSPIRWAVSDRFQLTRPPWGLKG